MHFWTIGPATAVGIGIGAAFAASMGPIGYLLGLTATIGATVVGRQMRRHG